MQRAIGSVEAQAQAVVGDVKAIERLLGRIYFQGWKRGYQVGLGTAWTGCSGLLGADEKARCGRMKNPMAECDRLWSELVGYQKQIAAGHAIHMPTFHRTVKAFEASVLGVMSARQTAPIARPSLHASRCIGKQRFINRESAGRHVASHPNRDMLDVYPCCFCGFWHYGNHQRVEAKVAIRSHEGPQA